MPTGLKWVLAGLVLMVLLAVNGHYGEFKMLTVVTLVGVMAWCGAGVLLAVRGVLRFLRR